MAREVARSTPSVACNVKKLPRPLDWYSATLLLGIKLADADKTLADITRLGLLYLFSLSGLHVFYVVKTLRHFIKAIAFYLDG